MHVLVPCASCARHIATTEMSCPFCARAVSEDLAARAAPVNTARLRRFAMFTFATTAASAVGVLAACGSSEMSTAFYGAPCTDADGACGFVDSGGFNDDGSLGYLPADASVVQDASLDADATIFDDSGDAGEDAD
jgi:hypothetical protein